MTAQEKTMPQSRHWESGPSRRAERERARRLITAVRAYAPDAGFRHEMASQLLALTKYTWGPLQAALSRAARHLDAELTREHEAARTAATPRRPRTTRVQTIAPATSGTIRKATA